MKRFAWISLLLAGFLMLAGCGNSAGTTLPEPDSEGQIVLSSAGEKADEDSTSKAIETTKPAAPESTSGSDGAKPAEKQESTQAGKPGTGAVVSNQKPEEREGTSSSRKETSKETTPPATESKIGESSPKPPATAETATSSADEKPKEPTQPSESDFDINYWVDYAKRYAQSIGLTLSSWAVECWDNPISAAAHCTNLAADIQGYLNRYAQSGEVTDVWIWAESLGNNQYLIYIGYA